MTIEWMLQSAEPSLLIIEERACKNFVVGVPHHAPAGTPTLPCLEHPNSDENAGFLGRYLAEKLGCSSIIACNYPVDVNKHHRSDYATQIAHWGPNVLIEIHGHGGINARSDIEISSGSAQRDRFSTALANRVRQALAASPAFSTLSICGEYKGLYFRASKSVTITDERWLAYHIELPPLLRKASETAGGKPPQAGYHFCDILAAALLALHGTHNI